GHVHIALSPQLIEKFREGYEQDHYFREKWLAAAPVDQKQYQGQCFFRSKEGLLLFRVNEEPTRLCIPRSEVLPLLARLHDSPFEAAHEG
ncbi:hypothetical protein BV25DRAFT_1767423, partial [Artomyces pyxidatus]